MRSFKRLAIVGAMTTVGVLGLGAAFAAWTSTGSGNAGATGGSVAASVVTSATTGTPLTPGNSTAVTVSITNPNNYPVKVLTISAGSSNLVNVGCTAGTVTTAAVPSAPATEIPANGSGTYTLQASMSATADNTCQSQSFTIPLTATLSS